MSTSHGCGGHWLIRREELDRAPLAPFSAGLVRWLDEAGTDAVLVRPDRFVFGTGKATELLAAWPG